MTKQLNPSIRQQQQQPLRATTCTSHWILFVKVHVVVIIITIIVYSHCVVAALLPSQRQQTQREQNPKQQQRHCIHSSFATKKSSISSHPPISIYHRTSISRCSSNIGSSSSCSSTCSTCSTSSSTSLFMFQYEDENKPKKRALKQQALEQIQQHQKTSASTPPPMVETQLASQSTPPSNPTPKIIVLGSTGEIGRHVIKNLMNIQQKIHVVAVVRDYEKACEVLYDEMIREHVDTYSKDNKPFLQVIVMDLVQEEDMKRLQEIHQRKKRRKKKRNNYRENDDNDDNDEDDELEYAVSATRFYNENIQDYSNDYNTKQQEQQQQQQEQRQYYSHPYDYIDPYQPLYDAIQNSTAIISTIGTVRSTIPFADYILKPWRIFLRPDLWCIDKHHPYFVNYLVMKKVLDCVEKEQRKRDEEWKRWNELNHDNETDNHNYNNHSSDYDNDHHDEYNNDNENSYTIIIGDDDAFKKKSSKSKSKPKQGDRIKIIRISDLCVSNPPWTFVTVLTNIMRSLVFRSQEQCEKLLLSSDIVDTIVLRPGDLVSEKRNDTITALEVNVDGFLPSPCYTGRQDVADFAVVAALSKLEPKRLKRRQKVKGIDDVVEGAGSTSTGGRKEEGDSKTYTNNLDNQSGGRSSNSYTSTRRQKQSKQEYNKMERDQAKHWNVAIGWTDKRISPSYTNSRTGSKYNDVKKAFQYVARKEYNRSRLEKANATLRNANLFYKCIIGPIKERMRQFQLQQTKPYGLFVLLPLVMFVYPMICSILFSIGKRIPIVEGAAVKLMIFIRPWWLMLIRLLRYGALTSLRNSNFKKLIY